MYTAQITKERIKGLCKIQKISMEQMLSELNLGVNAVRQITDTKGMSSVSLYKIADYLNVSVDYLLGRTDNPNINDNSIKTGDVKGINVKGDTSVTISETPKEHDTIKQNFIALFDNLSPENQIEVMYFTKQLMEKES